MQIWYRGGNKVEVKTKLSTIELSDKGSRVNDLKLVGPGEYEIADVEVHGFNSGAYLLKSDGIALVYLDGVSNLSQDEVEELGDVDVLFLPAKHPQLITTIDPRMIIPIGEGLQEFCKAQACEITQASLKLAKKDLADAEGKIVVLKS